MTDDMDEINSRFLSLVLSLQSAAMYQMGKIISPISGKIERDMEQARISIDLLTMLQEKTKGNLLPEEKKILESAVYNLQMNFVDEMNRDRADAKPSDEPPSEQKPPESEIPKT